jgi:hypothetical protein
MALTFYEMCTKEDIYLKNREDNYAGCSLELPDFVTDSIKVQFKKLNKFYLIAVYLPVQ